MSQVLQVNGDYLVKVSDGGTITLDTGSSVGDVVVTGNLIVDNDLTVNGSLTLGNEGVDNVLVLGEISSDLKPKISNIYDLGSEIKYWSTLYVSRIENPLGGLTIKNLNEPVDAQDAATKNYVDSSLGRVDNVFYVSKSGNDLNDGRTLSKAKLTIKSAVEAARQDINRGYDATIFVKSGDYIEDNPIRLPEKLSIWGDTLRATTVRPLNKTQDLFWVTNGNYLAQMTFKDHEEPAAAVAFPPPTEEFPAVAIHTSPYTQNCTSITTTGCGMRVDGAYVKGLRSMVLDAYTQYNQGGLGIHMLNRGNSQLVSAFTINCDIAFLCTTGGFCSLTNSNSSFGNFGLVADGVSEPLYSGILTGSKLGIIGDTITLNNLIIRPNVGDAISFNGSTSYYTVTIAEDLAASDIAKSEPDFSNQIPEYRTARQLIRAGKDKIATDTIDYVNETYTDLDYNQFKCTRDTLLIVDAAIDDAALGTNYKSIQAGMAYSRLSASVVRDEQLTESLDALLFTKDESLKLISSDSSIQGQEYTDIENNFDLIYNLFSGASSANPPTPPAYVFTPPVGAKQEKINARDVILANRDFLIQEGIAYIEQNLTFNYDKELCQRDVGLIIDAVGYDLMFGSNFRSITAGRSYYRAQAANVLGVQKTATIDAFNFLKTTLTDFLLTDAAAFESVDTNMNLIIDIIDQGLSAVPSTYTIPSPTDYDTGYKNARDLIEANREFLKAEVIEFIRVNYVVPSSFEYDQAACERDVDLILDAVYYDMTYQGNLETLIAGNAYYSFGTTSVIPGEENATLDAYNYLKEIIGFVSQDIDIAELQIEVTQVTGDAGSSDAADFAESLIEDIRDIIAENPDPEIKYPDLSWAPAAKVAWHELFQDERDDTQRLVTNFIDSRYFLLEYDRAVCQRDVGLIIDAVAYDLMFGSNFRTITAGRAYARGTASVVNTVQKTATIDAFNQLKEILVSIVAEQNDVSASNVVADLMDIILDILTNGSDAVPAYVIPNPVGYDVEKQKARNIIEDNREFIKAEVIEFIELNYSSLEYDKVKCERDVELILDAVYYDMTYGGNLETLIAGRAYYSFNQTVIPGEVIPTLAAYEYMKDIVIDIAQNIDVTELQSVVTQVTGTGSDVTAATTAGQLIEDIRTIISTPSAEPAEVTPSLAWVEPVLAAKGTELILEKEAVKEQVTDYIDDNYNTNVTPFSYNAEKCKRDVGLIVDALGWDFMFGSNFRSITAGRSYYRANASVVLDRQKQATIQAYEVLKDYVAELVSDSAEAVESVNDNMDMIIDIFDQGLTAVPDYLIPTPFGLDEGIRRARDLISANREFVKAEVIEFIEINYASVNYDQDKCKRDIDYILDAVYYDLTYGGNMETAIAANSYFVDAVTMIPGEIAATVGSYTFMKSLIELISKNVTVTPLQAVVDQVSGTPGTTTGATLAGNLINDVVTVIDTGVLIESPTLASTTGVDSELVNLYNQTQNEKENVKIAVADFIDSRFFLLTYNREKCNRDIGYIIDALGYDIMLGSDYRSIIAGRSYYRANANLVIEAQKSATIGSLRRLKEIAQATTGGNATAQERLDDRIELIVDIINRGPDVIPTPSIPNPPSYVSGYSNARALIEANRSFIKAEVIKYIEDNYPSVYASFDQTICERDIDYILDSVYYDITYDTNAESLVAGRSYYVGAVEQVGDGELVATIAAYQYMKTIMSQIATNTDISELQTEVGQVFGAPGSAEASTDISALIQDIVDYISDPENPPALKAADTSWVDTGLVSTNNALQSGKETIKTQIQQFIETKYSYSQATCARDIGYILDAMVYDQLYSGNSQTFAAAQTYYSAEVFQIGARERLMTANTFKFLRSVAGSCLLNITVTPLQTIISQDTSQQPADVDEVIKSNELFKIVAEVVENGFTSVITLNENIPDFDPQFPGAEVTFHQYSLITASGQTFEWVGAGVNVNTSLPYLGGQPIAENKAIETNGGKVYWTGTDQFGDFNIGGELVIRRDSGTIEGRTFTKSLFAVLTPYILAVGE